MKLLILAFVVIFSTALRASAVEITLTPSFGYSNYLGLNYRYGANVAFQASAHWQFEAGAAYSNNTLNNRPNSEVTTGAVYNFSDDLPRSFLIGAGVGYADHFDRDVGQSSPFGYLKFGKR